MPDNKTNQTQQQGNYEQYVDQLDRALQLSEQLMLKEKAAKGEDVIVSQEDGTIVHIPAQQILDEWDMLMDKLNLPLWKTPKQTPL